MYIDSHCHLNLLDLTPFEGSLQKVIDHAKQRGVTQFLCVGITLDDQETLASIADEYEEVLISTGLHPNESPNEPLDIARLMQAARHPKVVAIGETGLDYYRSQGELDWQKERFVSHIECAHKLKKPLIIHTRMAKDDTIDIMKANDADEVKGVMHCFTEDWEMAKKALDLDFYISFSGIVTFKNAQALQEVAQQVPLERMLIETDCPYLAPIPYRGKPNLPGYVSHVAEFIAELRQETPEKIGQATTDNFNRLFLA